MDLSSVLRDMKAIAPVPQVPFYFHSETLGSPSETDATQIL